MKEIFPSIYLLRPESPGPNTPYTYLLKRKAGNFLFATKADVIPELDSICALGGVTQIFLGDRHHALPHTVDLAKQLGAPISCSDVEAAVLKKQGIAIDAPLPLRRTQFAPDLEMIPTPGHTRGAFSYLWKNEGRRFLFIGDTLVPVDGAWQYWVTTPNRATMRETVSKLAELNFDVILSNSFASTPMAWLEADATYRKSMFAALAAAFAD